LISGKVKFFNEKNYGFVTDENGQDYFFHRKNLLGHQSILRGADVIFESPNGKTATDIIDVTPEETVYIGSVVKYFPEKRYGFINVDNNFANVFFLKTDYGAEPEIGKRVSFQFGRDINNRRKAINITMED
jgi:cold shock CspA family protein